MAELEPEDAAAYDPPQEIEPDSATEFSDEAASSVLTSIASEIKKGREENGRIYAAYGSQEYMLPVDEYELDRMDMQHHKYTLLQGDKLYLAPLRDDPQKILDIGTGTGIWAIEMAEKFHSAEVIGTDIAPVQPNWTPPNCYFEVDDCELDWQFKEASFDFIHTRDCYLSIRNWPRLIGQAYDHLKPGGWLELSCVWPVPKSDDGTLDQDSGYVELCQTFMDIVEAIGADADVPRRYKRYMLEQGFEDVEEVVFKVPTSEWPKDKRLKKVGALERLNLLEGGEAFLLRGMTKEFGRSRAEMEVMLMRMRKELMANKFHSYVSFYVVYGRKPDGKSRADA
ncbi:Secondary metabolism regulator LAE1 [Lasiodiplodia theobromae]|uniref:Secondary metabolism regulator LAE1 n=1 Tax=Lasiodiplodia theobromae TaxID=45133 RepID=A0A5N5D2L8_9PEZI|nr:Secondary metabolism regulator LAE1 [Lasiodiplodia theobromae]